MARKSAKEKQKSRRELEKRETKRQANEGSAQREVEENKPPTSSGPPPNSQADGPGMQPESYQGVRRGIGLVYYALLLLVSAIVMAFLGMIGFFAAGSKLMLVLALLAPLLIVTANVMGFVGKMKCLAVPKETGGRELVYVACVFEIVVVLMYVAGFVIDVPDTIESKSGLLSLAALVLFLFFLRQLAISIYEPQLAEKAANVLKIGVALFAGLILVIVGLLFLPLLAVGASFATFLLGLVGFVSYVQLLGGLRRALAEDQLRHLATRQKRAAKSGAEGRQQQQRTSTNKQNTERRQQQPKSTGKKSWAPVVLVAIPVVLVVGFISTLKFVEHMRDNAREQSLHYTLRGIQLHIASVYYDEKIQPTIHSVKRESLSKGMDETEFADLTRRFVFRWGSLPRVGEKWWSQKDVIVAYDRRYDSESFDDEVMVLFLGGDVKKLVREELKEILASQPSRRTEVTGVTKSDQPRDAAGRKKFASPQQLASEGPITNLDSNTLHTERDGDQALLFLGGQSRVETGLHYDGTHPITLEAWVKPRDLQGARDVICDAQQAGTAIGFYDGHVLFVLHDGNDYQRMRALAKTQPGEEVHIAGVFDGDEISLFVNGRLQQKQAFPRGSVKPSVMPITIGANPQANNHFIHGFLGLVDEVRISQVARYEEDFTPLRTFKADPETMLLYHFDGESSSSATDASSNGRTGNIVGASRIELER